MWAGFSFLFFLLDPNQELSRRVDKGMSEKEKEKSMPLSMLSMFCVGVSKEFASLALVTCSCTSTLRSMRV